MTLLWPELLLLGLPLAWLLWRTAAWPSVRFGLRALAALALLLALAGPYAGGERSGRDLVLVVDRSRSMPAGAAAKVAELFGLARDAMRSGDRLGLVAFGADAVIEQAPHEDPRFEGYRTDPDADASHLAAALDRALTLIPEGRPGSLLLYSDGEFHGAAPQAVARRAAARGVRIDVRTAPRAFVPDAAVERLELPAEVGEGEPFQFQAWVRAERATTTGYVLLRGEDVIARGEVELGAGLNPLRFRDLGRTPGTARYELRLELPGDRVLENNRGLGVTRIAGRRPLLLINGSGQAGRLAQALRGAGLDVTVSTPEDAARRSAVWLDGFRGFVLENVSANRLDTLMPALASQVEDLGAGVMITGGRASFGVGGYYRGPLDPLLPVTMELRVENRDIGLAIAFVLDRSGSMAASAGGGRTKMDLANAGTMAAIDLLAAIDEVTVIAVDSEPHVVVPMRPVDDKSAIALRVSGIQSGGGGIYVYNGLAAAAQQLQTSSRANRHIALFADAADAEQPDRYRELIDELRANGSTTLSVVALGTESDSDAAFLRDIAARGGGQIYFSQEANELPRLFAQDTLLAARSSFVDLVTGTRATAGLTAAADLATGPWLTLPGYNLCYLRPGASQGIVTTDDYGAPVLASMQAGLGRSVAFTGQVDGQWGIADADWPRAAATLVTMARWIASQEPPAQYFPDVRREGRQAVVSVEVDPELGRAGPLTTRMVGPDGRSVPVELVPVAEDRLEARVPLAGDGIYRFAAMDEQGSVLAMNPLAVPYSPEFETRSERDAGARTLGRVARLSGGRVNPPANEFWRGSRSGRATRSWAGAFVLAGLLLLLAEIAWRRLFEGAVRWRLPRVGSLRRPRTEARGKPRPPKVRTRTTARPDTEPTTNAPEAASEDAAEPEASLEDALRKLSDKRRR